MATVLPTTLESRPTTNRNTLLNATGDAKNLREYSGKYRKLKEGVRKTCLQLGPRLH